MEVPLELANRLEEARVARNRLAHTYLSERSKQFQTVVGRSEMIQELDEIGDQMHELYNHLDNVIVGWLRDPNRDPHRLIEHLCNPSEQA